ncbi:MAG: lysophospholipid acyltransferase (LPLAT)-like uncharacterized protein [Desulforhopalus sp.]|jgi:lysophospholipid acyltransferase (LPLAT)-like uncharacterized protein
MSNGFVNSLLLRIVPKLAAWIMRIWFATCRVTVHDRGIMSSIKKGDLRIVASFWHYSIIYIFYFVRNYSATAMVSASRDGEYIANLAKELGFNTVRGSKNNKGVGALKGMLRAVRSGDNGAIVADGSRGPARKAQAGALLVASQTGKPVVPMVWAGSRYFTIKSWDRTAVPKPFSRVDMYFGEPMYLPRKVSAEELEVYRRTLEKNLNDLYVKAWSVYGKTSHE